MCQHPAQGRGFAKPAYRPPSDPRILLKAMLVIESTNGVSLPDSKSHCFACPMQKSGCNSHLSVAPR